LYCPPQITGIFQRETILTCPEGLFQTFVAKPADKLVPVALPASDDETDDIDYRQTMQVPALAGDHSPLKPPVSYHGRRRSTHLNIELYTYHLYRQASAKFRTCRAEKAEAVVIPLGNLVKSHRSVANDALDQRNDIPTQLRTQRPVTSSYIHSISGSGSQDFSGSSHPASLSTSGFGIESENAEPWLTMNHLVIGREGQLIRCEDEVLSHLSFFVGLCAKAGNNTAYPPRCCSKV
jgi:hypothetical protein